MPLLLKNLIEAYMQPDFDFMQGVPRRHRIKDVEKLLPDMVKAAQQEYDDWDDPTGDHPDYAGGGICHLIADAIVDVLGQHGIEATTVDSGGMGEQHVWVYAQVMEGVLSIDISPHHYERGGGYKWTKLPDIVFGPQHVTMGLVSNNPNDFKKMTGYD